MFVNQKARMAEHEGLMTVLETEKGQVGNRTVCVIYEPILQSRREKDRSQKPWGLD